MPRFTREDETSTTVAVRVQSATSVQRWLVVCTSCALSLRKASRSPMGDISQDRRFRTKCGSLRARHKRAPNELNPASCAHAPSTPLSPSPLQITSPFPARSELPSVAFHLQEFSRSFSRRRSAGCRARDHRGCGGRWMRGTSLKSRLGECAAEVRGRWMKRSRLPLCANLPSDPQQQFSGKKHAQWGGCLEAGAQCLAAMRLPVLPYVLRLLGA